MFIKFKKKKKEYTTEQEKIQFWGEFASDGLNRYSTYEEIKNAIINEIIARLKPDIEKQARILKKEIADIQEKYTTLLR